MNNKEKNMPNKFISGKGVMNLPNQLTVSRIVMIPVFVLFFYLNFTGHYFVALAVFGIACLTDMLDGMIARKYNLITNLGKFLDPIADKVLVLTALVIFLTVPDMLAYHLGDWAIITAGCGVALILAREIIVSGFRMVAASSGMVIAADVFGKYKTVTQDIAIVVFLVGFGIAELALQEAAMFIIYFGYAIFLISVIFTVVSGINYLVKNNSVLKK